MVGLKRVMWSPASLWTALMAIFPLLSINQYVLLCIDGGQLTVNDVLTTPWRFLLEYEAVAGRREQLKQLAG